MHLSYLGPVSYAFSQCSPQWVAAAQELPDRRYCFPSWFPWRAGTTDDCDILVYWYGRKYSISQFSNRWLVQIEKAAVMAGLEPTEALQRPHPFHRLHSWVPKVQLKAKTHKHTLCKGSHGFCLLLGQVRLFFIFFLPSCAWSGILQSGPLVYYIWKSVPLCFHWGHR